MMKPTITLFLICFVVTAALALVYSTTRSKIDERAAADAESARKEVLSEADSFKAVDNLDNAAKGADLVTDAYRAYNKGTLSGYVFTVVSKGYGGELKVIVGVKKDGSLAGVKIAESKETPGLGTKAADEPFISQLKGFIPKDALKVVKGKKTSSEEIEAISGATITSRAVVNAVQAAVNMASELARKEAR